MTNLLLFFALPVATIILAVVLEQILDSPILVAATAFAIYLIVTFAAFDESFLIFALIYTILAYIAAVIARIIKCLIRRSDNSCLNPCTNGEENDNTSNLNNGCGCNNRSIPSFSNMQNRRRRM